ncbi:MAG: MiaB/RimO family radical SAM methylthiotransferase [Candidatus Omnitrophota bacterium]
METKPEKKARIGIISLGCPRNLVDSERILGRLENKGYKISDEMRDADIGIINTCAFIEEAKQESIDVILECLRLKKQGRLRRLIVNGCLAERYGGQLIGNLKDIDAVVGCFGFNHSLNRSPLTPSHYAYVKISEGCINSCSYCVIPKIKGVFTSRDPKSILKEITKLDKNGVKEVNLIGQDIGLYGKGLKPAISLTKLLREIIKATKNIKWLRLLYLHPGHIDAGLINLIAKEPKICKYVDLPIQHINDRILKCMNRGTTRKGIISLIEKLRRRIRPLCLRTSIIVGFPGETDSDFQELIDFIKGARFERLGAFIYSREEGTPAFSLPGQIPDKIKKERFDILMTVQQEISGEILRQSLGKTLQVLVDELDPDDPKYYLARTQDLAPEVDGIVYVKARKDVRAGTFLKVKISDTFEYDLMAEPI